MSDRKLQIIQFLRGVAALCIVITHAFWELKSMLAGNRVKFDDKVFPGDFGVDLFFVISGFIMVYSCWNQFQKPAATVRFVVKRLIRIVPLYWLLTTVMIGIVLAFPERINTATSDSVQWATSYLFIPYYREGDGLIRPVLGLGWTLEYEMFFYSFFAAALLLPRKLGLITIVVSIFATVVIANQQVPPQNALVAFMQHTISLEFTFGVILGCFFMAGARLNAIVSIFFLFSGLFFLFSVPGFNDVIDENRVLHYGLPATLIMAGCVLYRHDISWAFPKWMLEIGETSYSLYLTHPFVVGALAVMFQVAQLDQKISATQLIFVYTLTVLSLSIVIGVIVHRFVDKPMTDWLRGKMAGR